MAFERGIGDATFWRRHAAVGVLISFSTAGVILVWAQGGGAGADGRWLTRLALGACPAILGFWASVRYTLPRRRHLPVFYVWSVLSTAVALVSVQVTGGDESPLAPLLFLPLIYASLAYPWLAVLAIGVFEIGGLALLGFLDVAANTDSEVLLQVSLGLATLMATLAAHNRGTQRAVIESLTSRLEHQAIHDGLTDCLNRRGFDLALASEVARATRYERPLALLLLDIDHLKTINDTGGHARGDTAIRQVAGAMQAVARQSDIIGRLGGDEFAMLLPETDIDEANHLAARLHQRVRTTAAGVPVTVSVGLTGMVAPATYLPLELMRTADAALYAAKFGGRDRTELVRGYSGLAHS